MEKQELIAKEHKPLLPKIDLDTKKEIAKLGMTISMGITVATSMYMKNKFMKRLHVVAGVALVGFSYWHHTLYQPSKKKTTKPDLSEKVETQPEVVENTTEDKE